MTALLRTYIAILFGWGALLSVSSTAQAAAPRPNILVILADDMGYSDLGCYGGEISTPNLDRLAANGLRFAQFYNTGRCCPTRASLLTGLYPHQAGVGHMMNDRGHDGYRGELNRRCVTIAEALRPAGYGTYMVGKWHVTKGTNPEGPKDNWPLQRGFDRFYGTITGAGSFFDPGTLTRDNTMISPFADPAYQPEVYYYTEALTDHAVRFIREHERGDQQRPFFMYLAYTCAHWPMHALPHDIAKYEGRYAEGYTPIRERRFARLRELGLIDESWKLSPQAGDWSKVDHQAWEARCMEVYAAMIDNMDQGIGRIVSALRDQGQLDNTLIMFLQDNGGCQEGNGRNGDSRRPAVASLPPIAADAIRTDVVPKQNRAGVPTLTGPHVMPGPEDTYIAYGLNWANVSNTPFREYKHFVHEGGISTPLIAHWPAGIPRRGELEQQPGHLIDIMATCLDAAGVSYPQDFAGQRLQPLEGRSLVPAFAGQDIEREALYWEHEGNRAIRRGPWKLVAKEHRPWELYHLERDRTELHDLAQSEPARVKDLAAMWERWAERAHVLPLGTWRGGTAAPATRTEQNFSTQRKFAWSGQVELPREQAPHVTGRALRIQVRLKGLSRDGVLVAQGGTAHGYALYLRQGHVYFAVRRSGQLTTIASLSTVSSQDFEVQFEKSGRIVVRAAGIVVAEGEVGGPLTAMPVDGLQTGRDTGGVVGNYDGPFAYQGEIAEVTLEIDNL